MLVQFCSFTSSSIASNAQIEMMVVRTMSVCECFDLFLDGQSLACICMCVCVCLGGLWAAMAVRIEEFVDLVLGEVAPSLSRCQASI